jgi:hypothetical protein
MATEQTATTPFLNPAPGRCVVRIVPRLLQTETADGIVVELDGRYENQPMVGVLLVVGDPCNSVEEVKAKWAVERAKLGELFVFSQYGSGSPYWNDEMRKMLPLGYDFRWLQGLRLFDIGQLGATISGAGQYGEVPVPPEAAN